MSSYTDHVFVELIKTDKDILSIELLRAMLSVIPCALPTKIPPAKLISILSRYLIHLDKGINHITRLPSALLFTKEDKFS
jgi:hypothetical protein